MRSSQWLDIGQFLGVFIDRDGVEVNKSTKIMIIFSHLDLMLAGKQNYMRIYNMAKKRTFTSGNNAENP